MRTQPMVAPRAAVMLLVACLALGTSTAPLAAAGPVSAIREETAIHWGDTTNLALFGGNTCPPPATTTTSATVSYTAGWQLISGPAGSCVRDASALVLIEPVATDHPDSLIYWHIPLDTRLSETEVYWAYFPAGGTLELTDDQLLTQVLDPTHCFEPEINPGQWIGVINPSATLVTALTATAAQQLWLYDPVRGYYQSRSLPVGSAAWLLQSDTRDVCHN